MKREIAGVDYPVGVKLTSSEIYSKICDVCCCEMKIEFDKAFRIVEICKCSTERIK